VSEHCDTPAAPVAGDVVEIVDQLSGARVSAVVVSVSNEQCVLRLDGGSAVPVEGRVRWYDGDAAWQVVLRLERVDETGVMFQLPPARKWQSVPVRRALRAAVDNSPILVKIVTSAVLATDHRVHAVCLDISAGGCLAKWPGPAPLVGERVEVAWDVGDWNAETEPGWVPARVSRIAALHFRARQVAFTFEIADALQAARVRAWHQAWLQEYRERRARPRAA
jgi:hypothetical protein